MKTTTWGRLAVLVCSAALLASSSAPAIKNLAVVASASSKLQDVPLAELAKLCKGAQKTWTDGKGFTLVMKDPESADMGSDSARIVDPARRAHRY